MSASPPPPEPTRNLPRLGHGRALAILAVASLASFCFALSREPHFADESAYVSQAYFLDLVRQPDDPGWVEYPAYDLPPLPKYLIAAALRAAGEPIARKSVMRAWYNDTRVNATRPSSLLAARIPSVLLGVVGCLAIYALGAQVGGPRVGLVAGLLLAFNPLYRLHARRAMSDVPAEAFILVTLALGLYAWRRALEGRASRLAWAGIGGAAGLAVLSKLNGGLGLMTIWAWCALGMLLPIATGRARAALAATAVLASAVALATFVVGNPFVTARPPIASLGPPPSPLERVARQSPRERIGTIVEHRVVVSARGREQFPDDALTTLGQKAAAVAVQGFGRFGPLGPSHADSRIRFDPRQDWGATIYLPTVAAGLCWALASGRRGLSAGRVPVSWAVVVQFLVALVTVTLFIPLAWDRYYLSIQAGSALLSAGVLVAAVDRVAGRQLPGPPALRDAP